jgi:hypothetical protein
MFLQKADVIMIFMWAFDFHTDLEREQFSAKHCQFMGIAAAVDEGGLEERAPNHF